MPRDGLILIDQPMLSREQQQLQSVGDSQFIKNVRHVVLGSVLTDAKLLRKILVRVASTDKCNDLLLAGSKAEIAPVSRSTLGRC